jgi:hypothetical protein
MNAELHLYGYEIICTYLLVLILSSRSLEISDTIIGIYKLKCSFYVQIKYEI